MTASEEPGSRTIVTLIDQYASEDPSRVWAVVPIEDSNLSKGFKSITYGELANAISHAALWLQQNLDPSVTALETIAYAGPKDIRYPIIAVAAAKVGRKLLLPSPYASITAQSCLLDASSCRAYLYASSFGANVEKVLSGLREARPTPLQIPDLSEWLTGSKALVRPFEPPWHGAESEPWLIFHTSGTTGLPKLVTYTHRMMASLDTAELMPDADRETMNRHFENKRWYTPLPSLHFVGMTVALQFTVYLGSVLVVGPVTSGPASVQVARDTMRYGNVKGAMLPPALIDGLCEDDAGLDCLRNLEYLYFAGAPLLRKTAEKLLGHVTIKPAMGSTEAGVYFLQLTSEDDWEYYYFRPAMGLEFRHIGGELYEPVFVRQPALERWQQVFQVYPDLHEFPTKDVFSPHPSKPGFWKYVGRTDDMIAFSHGECLYASGIEDEISKYPRVAAVLVGGQGRTRPFVLVEWKDGAPHDMKSLEGLWHVMEQANQSCSDLVKLSRDLVLFAVPEKPLVRTAKGSVARRESEQLFAKEIELLYEK